MATNKIRFSLLGVLVIYLSLQAPLGCSNPNSASIDADGNVIENQKSTSESDSDINSLVCPEGTCGGGSGGPRAGRGAQALATYISAIECGRVKSNVSEQTGFGIRKVSENEANHTTRIGLSLSGQKSPSNFIGMRVGAFANTDDTFQPKDAMAAGLKIVAIVSPNPATLACPANGTCNATEVVVDVQPDLNVAEDGIVSFSNGMKASLFNKNEKLVSLCTPDVASKITVKGYNMPLAKEKPYAKVTIPSAGCTAYILTGELYTQMSNVASSMTLPGFNRKFLDKSKSSRSEVKMKIPGDPTEYKIYSDNGQLVEGSPQACNLQSIFDYQTLNVQIGTLSNYRGASNLAVAPAKFGLRLNGSETGVGTLSALDLALCGHPNGSPTPAPQPVSIARICVTPRAMFDRGILSNKCSTVDTATLKVKPGDVVTVIGLGFQVGNSGGFDYSETRCPDGSLPNASNQCPDLFTPGTYRSTARTRIPVVAKVFVGGAPISSSVTSLFAYQDGSWHTGSHGQVTRLAGAQMDHFAAAGIAGDTSTEDTEHPFSGQCVSQGTQGGNGRLCKVIHIVVPKKACGEEKFVGITIQNPDGGKDIYGGKPIRGGSPLERKLKCDDDFDPCDPIDNLLCGPAGPTPTPTATPVPVTIDLPPRVPTVSANVSGTNLEVRFTEVGDDPTSTTPVHHYEVRYSRTAMNTDADFSSALPLATAPGIAVGSVQTFTLVSAPPGVMIYFGVQAFDNSGQVSNDYDSFGVPLGPNFGKAQAMVAAPTPTPVPTAKPCPVTLAIVSMTPGAGPNPTTGTVTLRWTNVYKNGSYDGFGECTTTVGSGDINGVALGGGPYTYLPSKATYASDFQATLNGYGGGGSFGSWKIKASDKDAGFPASLTAGVMQTESFVVPLNSNFIFGAKVWSTGIYSEISNMVTVMIPAPAPPTGSGKYALLSNSNAPSSGRVNNNLPINWALTADASTVQVVDINAGQRIQTLPGVSGSKFSSILIPDMDLGLTVYKPAEVSALFKNVNTALDCLPGIQCGTDIMPIDPAALSHQNVDGMPDLLDRDRHFSRYGSNKDCDGREVGNSTQYWSQVDSYASCNFPQSWMYGVISDIEVGRVNADSLPDVLMANSNSDPTLSQDDVAYINTGDDLCDMADGWDGTGRTTDVADGIPCFHRPIALPWQLDTYKGMTKRIKLFTMNADPAFTGAADFIVDIPVAAMDPNSNTAVPLTFYRNDCKSRSGACSNGDFVRITPSMANYQPFLVDSAGNDVTTTLQCEDVTFARVDSDQYRDIICVRNAQFYGSAGERISLVFTHTSNDTFVMDETHIGGKFIFDCNSAFATSAEIGGSQFLMVGHTNLALAEIANNDPDQDKRIPDSCSTRIYKKEDTVGTWTEVSAALPGYQTTCHNGLLLDSRNLGRVDALLACGIGLDMYGRTEAPVSSPTFMGTNIYLSDASSGFSSRTTDIFWPTNGSKDPGTEPVQFQGNPFASSGYLPGACNAVGASDIDADGVLDLLFAPGVISTDGRNTLQVFRQKMN